MSDESRPVPKRLADFEVVRRLGVGGMAEVFLAKKRGAEGTYKLLVVKRILPAHDSSRRFRAMFAEEAQLATRLNHPNIVQVYDFQDYGDEGQLLSMEYVEGPDLRRLQRSSLAKKTKIPPYVSAYIVAEVAKGLHYAHERRDEGGKPLEIVHRDVSPQNILLSFDGAVKIADFGIASASLFRDEPGVLKGKTGYMSPEQAHADKVDRRTDVYSLGVVFHELLTGRLIHGAAEGQKLLEVVRAGQVEPPSLFAPEIPPELEAIVMRALSRDRTERFQTARDLAAAITRVLFQKQEPVDAHVLEQVIVTMVGRESVPAEGVDAGESDGRHGSEHGRSEAEPEPPSASEHGTGRDRETGPGGPVRPLHERAGREVRHIAVVRLRLVGFSKLASTVGPAMAKRFFDRLKGILDEIAFKRGGRWSWDPAPIGGFVNEPAATSVVGLLANPSRSAADAASLAVDVHDAVHGASDDLAEPIQATVGIVRGIATGRRDRAGHLVGHVLQEPAEYLARLIGEQAPPGQTWVAGGLYRLVRRDFVWGDAPTISLEQGDRRSLPRNMRIYALERPLTREEKLALMSHAPRDLVGRDAELADLHAAYHRAVTPTKEHGIGHVTARAIIGEMGIGKSALVNALAAELPPDARVVRVECSPASSELPFSAVGQFVREFTGTRMDQAIDEARSIVLEALGDFAGGRNRDDIVTRLAQLGTGRLAEASDEADVAHNRRLLTSGVRRLFARAAIEAPLVVVIDSLQWCDRASLELITTLVRRGDPLPVLTLLVTRPDERVTPLLEGIVRVELRGLSSDNQVRLVQAHVGATEGVAQICTDLVPRAAGNPFFLLEMIDALLERGALELKERGEGEEPVLARTERGDDGKQPLPSTLEQLIADRLNELPEEEHAVVLWLAVTGGPLTTDDLKELSESDPGDAIVRLCARGLCDDRGDVVDVRHPLTRDVAYLAIEAADREVMHRKLGMLFAKQRAVEGLGAAIVAQHLARGNARAEAANFYLEAASAALASYQLVLAARYYRRAVKLAPRLDPSRLSAFEALENIARIQGKWRDRRRYLASLRQLARENEKPYWVAVALIRTARFDLDAGRLARGLTLAQKGEIVSRTTHSARLEVEAQLLMAEMLRDLGDMQGALAACDRALDTAGRATVPARLRAEVLRAQGTLLLRVGRVQEAVDAHADAIAVFRHAGARRLEARAKNSLAFAMFVLSRFEDAIALGLEAIRIDLAIGGRFQIARTLANIGRSFARLGDYARARSYLSRAREAHQRYGDQDGRAETLLATAEVLLEVDETDAAAELVGDAGALTAVTGSAYDAVHEKILRALLARKAGDSGAAVMHAFDGRQVAEAQAYVAFHFYAMAIEARARVDIGEHHTGILLATTASGAIETIQGSEYGLETRALCCEALETARSPQAPQMRERAEGHARTVRDSIRAGEFRRAFERRRIVVALLGEPARDSSASR
ncbi:MAG TPA: protein kinase [Polyangiaceae bacterium]|jgi:serine/threonine protein kinase/tetratricopeptide (TPR) repeat protein/ABC-type molybdenum transport system ATPase subunit/photorepair protein PhrA|nr:protein kinase [Polyangiaceae bacterium]